MSGSEPDGPAGKGPGPAEVSLAALIMVARFHEVSADFDTLSHRFPADPGVPEATRLLRVAKALGLKAGVKRIAPDRLDKASLPALAANPEHLVLTGTAAINGTGNADANRPTGNAAANRLDGGAGIDESRRRGYWRVAAARFTLS